MREDRPLIIFTALAQMGAGIAAVQPVLWWAVGRFIWPAWIEVAAVALLLLAGMAVSLIHLGRRRRMLFVMFRIYRSSLSLELLLTGITFAAALFTFLQYRTIPTAAWRITNVTALLLLLSIGLVYRLSGQLTWRGITVVMPLMIGLLWGALFHLAVTGTTSGSPFWLVVELAVLDMLMTVIRWRQIERSAGRGQPRNPAQLERKLTLMITRLAVTDLLTLSILFLFGPLLALIPLTAGVFIDRYLFYALGVQHSTESEISRVESLIPGL